MAFFNTFSTPSTDPNDPGYRAPNRSLTIQALDQRMKAMQDASAASYKVPQMSSPWQGAAYLGNILGSQYQEGQAENADIGARNRVAEIKRGIDWTKGPSNDQYAEWSQLDPEGADKIMKDFTDYQHQMAQKQQEAALSSDYAKLDAEAKATNMPPEEYQRRKKQLDDLAAAKTRMETPDQWTSLNPDDIAAQPPDSDVRKNPDAYTVNRKTNEIRLRNPAVDPGSSATIKNVGDMQQTANGYDSALNRIERAKSLIPQMMSGGAGQLFANLAGLGGQKAMDFIDAHGKDYGLSSETINATKEFYQIVGLDAIQQMSATLKGATSDREMGTFMATMADPNSSPQQKMNALQRMESAIQADRNTLSQTLAKTPGGAALPDYKYDPSTMTAPVPGAPAPGGNKKSGRSGDVSWSSE